MSEQQSIIPLPDSDWFRLEASVPNDSETQWWVFSLGENLQLHEPVSWREVLEQRYRQALKFYSDRD